MGNCKSCSSEKSIRANNIQKNQNHEMNKQKIDLNQNKNDLNKLDKNNEKTQTGKELINVKKNDDIVSNNKANDINQKVDLITNNLQTNYNNKENDDIIVEHQSNFQEYISDKFTNVSKVKNENISQVINNEISYDKIKLNEAENNENEPIKIINNDNILETKGTYANNSFYKMINNFENDEMGKSKIHFIEEEEKLKKMLNMNTFNDNYAKLPIYHINEFFIQSTLDFSTEIDYLNILRKNKSFNKTALSLKLIVLKERRWIRELIEISEMLKVNRENLDSASFLKYLNLTIRLNEQFNWLTWAIAYFFTSLLYSEETQTRAKVYKSEEFNLPPVDSLEWIHGFEWKGLFIRIQQESESNELFTEIECLRKCYIEYLQLIEIFSNDSENKKTSYSNYISSDIIFPLISTIKFYGLVLVVSIIIPTVNCENSVIFGFNDKNKTNNTTTINKQTKDKGKDNEDYYKNNLYANDMNNNSKFFNYFPNESKIEEENKFDLDKEVFYFNNFHLKEKKIDNSRFNLNIDESNNLHRSKNKINDISDYTFDNSVVQQYHPEELEFENFIKNDIKNSFILSKIKRNNLIKTTNDYEINHNNNTTIMKFKYILINASHLIPDLVNKNKIDNTSAIIISDNDKIPIEFSEKDLIDDEICKLVNNVIDASYKNISGNSLSDCNFNLIKIVESLFKEYKNYIVNRCINSLSKESNNEKSINFINNLPDYLLSNSENMFSINRNVDVKIIYSGLNALLIDEPKSMIGLNHTKDKDTKEESKLTEYEKTRHVLLSYDCIKSNNRANEIISFFLKNITITSYNLFKSIKKTSFYSRLTKLNDVLEFSNLKERLLKEQINENSNYKKGEREKEIKNKNKTNYSNDIQQNNPANNSIYNISDVKGPIVMICKLKENVKLGYSIIPAINICKKEVFKSHVILNFNLHLEKFISILNSQITLDNISGLKKLFDRYSIPLQLIYFIIPKVKLNKISELLQIYFFVDIIKNFLFTHEGLNFVSKIFYITWNNHLNSNQSREVMRENFNIVNDGFFPFIKENNFFNIFREKLYQIIITLFSVSKAQPSFVNFFFDQINIGYFMKLAELRILGHALFEDIDDGSTYKDIFSKEYVDIFIKNLILIANEKSFIFLSAIELAFNVIIDPTIKFKASISKENFLENFVKSNFIREGEFTVISPIVSEDLIGYVYSAVAPSEETLEKFTPEEEDLDSSTMGPKINKIHSLNAMNKHNNLRKTSILSCYKSRNKISNNSNIANNKLNDQIAPEDIFLKSISDHSDLNNEINDIKQTNNHNTNSNIVSNAYANVNEILKKKNDKLMSKLLNYSDLFLSPLIYKLKVNESILRNEFIEKLNETINESNDNINEKNTSIRFSNLKYKYAIENIKQIRDWRNRIDLLMDEVVSVNCLEYSLFNVLSILFLYYFFIAKDHKKCKDFLGTMKEMHKITFYINLEETIIINIFDGMIIEKSQYIESEGYYSKAIGLGLILNGDIRGKSSNIHPLFFFCYWKLSRQLHILESLSSSENFKEMFHCLDFYYKANLEIAEFCEKIDLFSFKDNNEFPNILNISKANTSINYEASQIEGNLFKLVQDNFYPTFLNNLFDSSLKISSEDKINYGLIVDFYNNKNQRLTSSSKNMIKIEKTINNEEENRINNEIPLENKDLIQHTDYSDIDEYVNDAEVKDSKNIKNEFINMKDNHLKNNNINNSGSDSFFSSESYCLNYNTYYNFPSISNVKKDYSENISSSDFIIPFFTWIMSFLNYKSNINYDEEYLISKFGNELIKNNIESNNLTTNSSFRSNNSNSNILTTKNLASSNIFENLKEQYLIQQKEKDDNSNPFLQKQTTKVGKKKLLSSTLYDLLLNKLSIKNCLPKGFLMIFGKNDVCQTSHTNYELIGFPRLCFKLKEEIIDKVSCGYDHVIALSRSKKLYGWGNNQHGQCGINPILNQQNINYIKLNNKILNLQEKINEVIATSNTQLSNKSLNGFGYNYSLFSTYIENISKFSNIINSISSSKFYSIISNPSVIKNLNNIVNISAGNDFSLALDVSGNVFSWGKSDGKMLGYNLNNQMSLIENDNNLMINISKIEKIKKQENSKTPEFCFIPNQVSNLKNIKSISNGSYHIHVIDNKSKVFTWGSGEGGQLGISLELLDNFLCAVDPLENENLSQKKIVKISSGDAHSLALSSKGEVYSWGTSTSGQLGLGFCEDSFEPGTGITQARKIIPEKISFYKAVRKGDKINLEQLNDIVIIDINVGKTFSFAIDKDGGIYGFGNNSYVQLAMSNNNLNFGKKYECDDILFPLFIDCFSRLKVKKIACGENHCLAVIEDVNLNLISIWSWGLNKFGQLGNGSTNTITSPNMIEYFLEYNNLRIIDICCGANFSLCHLSDYIPSKSGNIVVS